MEKMKIYRDIKNNFLFTVVDESFVLIENFKSFHFYDFKIKSNLYLYAKPYKKITLNIDKKNLIFIQNITNEEYIELKRKIKNTNLMFVPSLTKNLKDF